MKYFLIVYNRHLGQIMELREYADSQRERALKDRFTRELEEQTHPEIEVVLLSAESRVALEKTHSRYFKTLGELAEPFPTETQKLDFSFMEVTARPSATTFQSVPLVRLREAMEKSEIRTFGWPIAAVIATPDWEPKPVKDGIEARITDEGHRDHWILKRSGEFYFIGELFENNRQPTHVFLDTRTNRIAESFMRVAKMYAILGVPNDEIINFSIKHGNIKGKILGFGNPARILFPTQRISNVNEVTTKFSVGLLEMLEVPKLKEHVHAAVRDLAEMFAMFDADKVGFTDPIVEAFVAGHVI